jgi:flagellar biosynthetic protein FliP
VLLGLALALTSFIMAPTAGRVYNDALGPLLDDKISQEVALARATGPIRDFLLKQTRHEDLRLFYDISRTPRPETLEDVPLTVAAPAFMVSELTTAFRMGLFLYIPLILVDVLVSVVLMALGMMMVPPTLISLPLKVSVFLLADGWHLIVASLAQSFS